MLEVRTFLDVSYGAITAEEGRNGPDWAEIERAAREHTRWILLPEGLHLPADSTLRRYQPQQFDREVLLNTACDIISRTRMPMYRRMLGLIDEEGRYSDMLEELLKYYTCVKVVTRNLAHYRFAAERMMQELGAPVLIAQELSSLSDCVLALCPGPYSSNEDFRMPCPVISSGGCSLRYRFDEFHGLQAGLPVASPPAPPGIHTHLFAGAFYELCGADWISPTAHYLLFNHKVSSLSEAVRTVALMAGISCCEAVFDSYC